jgi:predicted GIY-YIG superfamily endonuclease
VGEVTEAVRRRDPQFRFLYRWFDANGKLLYIGITTDPEARERHHRSGSWWIRWASRCDVEYPQVLSLVDAERDELRAITTEGPVFNKQGVHDPFQRVAAYLDGLGINPYDYADRFPHAGRPYVENPRDVVVTIRLTVSEKALVDAAAARDGMKAGPWMRLALQNADI